MKHSNAVNQKPQAQTYICTVGLMRVCPSQLDEKRQRHFRSLLNSLQGRYRQRNCFVLKKKTVNKKKNTPVPPPSDDFALHSTSYPAGRYQAT